MTTPTQIRIDNDVKKDATALFKSLGLDMSSAVNLFLHQCLIHGGLPFQVENPKFKKEVLNSFKEAKQISKDKTVKSYSSINDLNKSLDED